jgi:hypothetical protein
MVNLALTYYERAKYEDARNIATEVLAKGAKDFDDSQSTTTASDPKLITPATGRWASPTLRPTPPSGIMSQQPGAPMMPPEWFLQEGEQLTHVTGGLGMLLNAPCQPAAPGETTVGAKNYARGTDGKFPCPHCTKTYLHANHFIA